MEITANINHSVDRSLYCGKCYRKDGNECNLFWTLVRPLKDNPFQYMKCDECLRAIREAIT